MPPIPEDWPLWAILLFLALSTFRGSLIKLLPGAVRSYLDRAEKIEEHEQEIEEIQLNARLQTQASEQLRKSWREEMLLEIIQNQQSFSQDTLLGEVQALADLGHKIHEELLRLTALLKD